MMFAIRFLLFVCVAVALAGCTRDLHSKFMLMKQEAIWLQKTCVEGLANDAEFVYKGSTAYIAITCVKPADVTKWVGQLEAELLKRNWKLKKREVDANIFCLDGNDLHLVVVPIANLERRRILISYPVSICAAN